MTHVNKSPVRREVTDVRGNALVVMIVPEGLLIREKGRRTNFLLPHGAAYIHAVKLHVANERRVKLAARKARRAAK